MNANIRIPNFFGGVSKVSQNARAPQECEAMDNCDMNVVRGVDKRPGTIHIAGEGAGEWLNATVVGDEVYCIWVNRSATERHLIIIDPDGTDTNYIQAFNVLTGAKLTVDGDFDLDDVPATLQHADNAELATYVKAGTVAIRKRYSHAVVEDAIFILNREVNTALAGTASTYRDAATTKVRRQVHAHNVDTWSDFTHPPGDVAGFPSLATLLTGGNIDNDAIWYARDDDVGLQQGFYWATSTTQPPWFQRLPTEGANSHIDKETMPVKLTWNGTKYTLKPVTWTFRQSGDSTTNPGPSFIGNPISDMLFHGDRFWFLSGENVYAGRTGDLLNLWQKSVSLEVDSDPIRKKIQGTRISNAVWGASFKESLIVLTDGSRQVEFRANGPITPTSTQMFDSTHVFTSDYIKPMQAGNQMYFMGERDFSNILWEYLYLPDAVSNVANDATERVHGYIPAEAFHMAYAAAHDQVFVLTRADTDAVYVNKSLWRGNEKALNAWYRWVYPGVTTIESCNVYDDHLYLLVWRSDEQGSPADALFLEKQVLGQPAQTENGSPAQTLGYAVRADRRVEHNQGVFAAGSGLTTWTLGYLDAAIDEIVLSPTWDTATSKMAGTRVPVNSVTVDAGADTTAVTAVGDYENNDEGTDCPACLGRAYNADLDMSELFYVDPRSRNIVHGNLVIMRGKIRHRDAAGYSVIITPEGRATLTKTFVPQTFAATPLDSDQLEDFGEFQFRVMAHSRNLSIKLRNDSPYPNAWVDAEFWSELVPNMFSPVR